MHVFRAVLVDRALVVLLPLDDESILDAVLGKSRRLLDSAQWVRIIGRKRVHRALVAGGNVGYNNASLALEALSAPIDQISGDSFLSLSRVVDLVHHRVDPSASLHVVQPGDDDLELPEKLLIKVLNRLGVRINRHPLNPLHDERAGDMGLELANIRTAEQKLSV